MTKEPLVRAEQQGDGQPENVRELEDEAGGAALAESGAPSAPRRVGDSGASGAAPSPADGEDGGDVPDRTRRAAS